MHAAPQTAPLKAPAGDKRRHPRVGLNMLVQFRSTSYDAFLTEYAPNISISGMFIKTDTPRPEGSTLYFQFTAADTGALIEGLGRVVRVVGPGEGPAEGMGIEFLSLEPASYNEISRLIAERES